MAESDLPPSVRAFLRGYIETFEELACVLSLHRRRGVVLSLSEVAQEAQISREDAASALDRLAQRDLVQVSSSGAGMQFSLDLSTTALEATLAELARTWKDRQLEVVKLMSANALERVRISAIRTFADAFSLRKKNPDG